MTARYVITRTAQNVNIAEKGDTDPVIVMQNQRNKLQKIK